MKFYEKNWVIWVSLFVLTPVGIFLLWHNKKYHKYVRVALSVFFGIVFLSAGIDAMGADGIVGMTGLIGFLVALVILIIHFIKKKSKKIPAIALGAFFVLFIIGVGMPSSEPVSESNNTEKVKKKQQSEEKTEKEEPKESKEKITFNLTSAKYNTEKDQIEILVETNVPDGTTVTIGLDDKNDKKNIMPVAPDSDKVKDGKLEVIIGDLEENPDLGRDIPEHVQNGSYLISAGFSVGKTVGNEHLLNDWGTYKNFKNQYSIDGEVKETDKGYILTNIKLGDIEITEAYTAEEIAQKEAKAKKANAKKLDFKKLNKNPDRYAGEYVTYTGEIIQIMEDNNLTHIRLALDDWGNDVIFIEYNGYTDFVEGNKVTIYGEVYGAYSYKSQAGWDISLPGIIADVIEK